MVEERAFELGQREILERIATGVPLAAVLEQIVLLVEQQAKGMLCSILRVDAESRRVRHGAAPNLPPALSRGIDGAEIGEGRGSCGTAAHRRQRVIVEDIASHPFWADYRHLALPFGLRACWSTPIVAAAGEVVGTFAMYHREARGPSERELAWVDQATHLAAIALARDQAEAVIRQGRRNEELHALVHNGVTDILFYLAVESGEHYRFLSVNPAFLRATGLREGDVVGRPLEEVIPPASIEQVRSNYRRAIHERATVTWDEITVYPAGTKYGSVSVTPVFDASGGCTNLVGTVHDVTERREAEEQIRAQAALLDQARDAILVRDLDRTVHYWNAGAERLYGFSASEVLGHKVTELLYRETQAFERAEAELLDAGVWSGELSQFTKAGQEVVIEGSWTLLRDAQGRPKSVLAINTDITRRKALEAQVMRAQRMESLGILAGGIAHDFNNMLAAISANATLASEDVGPSHPAHEALRSIEEASVRAADLVRQILTFSRDHEPQRKVMRLEPVVLEALKLLRATLPASIELEQRCEPGMPNVFADPTQVHQVVMNLGTNAVHAMREQGGKLVIRGDRVFFEGGQASAMLELEPGSYARLVVEDTGPGLDAPMLERIFDPFFTTKDPGQGTGLGLSVVHGIMKTHQGGIAVESTPGRGTKFSLYFPSVLPAVVEAEPAPTEVIRGNGERVLCVDDDAPNARATARLLRRLGYEVVEQTDPLLVLETMRAAVGRFDALVTDSSMPGLGGLELARRVLAFLPGLAVVVTTGRAGVDETRAWGALGVHEVLQKPASVHDLAAAVHRALGRREQSSKR